jgi:hypothetical protein
LNDVSGAGLRCGLPLPDLARTCQPEALFRCRSDWSHCLGGQKVLALALREIATSELTLGLFDGVLQLLV